MPPKRGAKGDGASAKKAKKAKKAKAGGAAASSAIRVTLKSVAELAAEEGLGEEDLAEFTGDLGMVQENPCTQHVYATIWAGAAKIGSAQLMLVDRDHLDGVHFHEVCDETSELYTTGTAFCSASGRAKPACVVQTGEAASAGGFLYIGRITIDADRRAGGGDASSGIGAAALRLLLLQTALAGRWTLAVYIPDSNEFMPAAEAAASRDFGRDAEPTAAQLATHRARDEELCDLDARQFIRAGFRQGLSDDNMLLGQCKHFFAVPSFLHGGVAVQRTHAQALAVAINSTYPPRMVGRDNGFERLIAGAGSMRGGEDDY